MRLTFQFMYIHRKYNNIIRIKSRAIKEVFDVRHWREKRFQGLEFGDVSLSEIALSCRFATTSTWNCKTSIHFLRISEIFQRDLDCYWRNIKRYCNSPVWPVDHEYFLRQHGASYRRGGLKFCAFVVTRAWFSDSYLELHYAGF